MSHAHFAIQISSDAVQHEHSLIFLAGLFLDKKENALPFNVADSSSFAVMVEQCIKFGQQHPGRKNKVPNRRRISGALFDYAYEDTGA